MPWCPNCKMEYQKGVTVCSDCKLELVDDLNSGEILVPFFQAEDKRVAEKLVRFFQYSDLNSSMNYDEENDIYIVSVPPKKQSQAKKLYQAFYFVERERLEDLHQPEDDTLEDTPPEADTETVPEESASKTEADCEDDENNEETPTEEVLAFDEEEEDASTYVMKEDQYKDLSGTVAIFLVFGIGGIVFVILNVIGILQLLNGWLPNGVMGAVFLSFIYIALSTNKRAKILQTEIDKENELTKQINSWLALNVTESFLADHHDETISNELNYIKNTETIKELLLKEFGPQNPAYLDRLIEEYYNRTFD